MQYIKWMIRCPTHTELIKYNNKGIMCNNIQSCCGRRKKPRTLRNDIYLQECLSVWIHYGVSWQHNTSDLTDISFVLTFTDLSSEQCCLQTLITSTYRFASLCGGPLRGTRTGKDANSLLSRHWQPQTAWRYNYWPFLRRSLFLYASGIQRKVFQRSFSVYFSTPFSPHIYTVLIGMEKVMKSLYLFPLQLGWREE